MVLFLGAWDLPPQLVRGLKSGGVFHILALIELLWLLTKAFLLMLLIIWVSKVNSRSRVDQITDFAWKVLSPFALIALVGASLLAGWRAI